MNQFKKYFQFSGTINGTNYFLRQLLATIIAFFGGFGIGFGVGQENSVSLLIGIIIAAGAIWLSLTTMYKRFEALHPEQAGFFTASLFSLQTLTTAIGDMQYVSILLNIALVIVGFYLVFANSKIESHEG